MSEQEQEEEGEHGPDWKDHAIVEAGFLGLEGAGCCLFSLLGALALFLLPVSALLMLIR